jgi:hypothetical protein
VIRRGAVASRAFTLAAALAAALGACAAIGPQVHKLPDGRYQITCAQPLSRCLEAFETICDWHGYDVLSATERRKRGDLRDSPNETFGSEAEVRCRPGEALFGGASTPPAPATPAPAPVAPAPVAPPRPTVEAPGPGGVPACAGANADGGTAGCGTGTPAAAPVEPR